MKKILLGLNLFALTNFALPSGTFTGSGVALDRDRNTEEYTTSANVSDNLVTIDYTWHGFSSPTSISFLATNSDWFDVFFNGEDVGDGLCLPAQCYYVATIANISYRESLYFSVNEDNEIYIIKAGSKFGAGLATTWRDELYSLP